MALTVHRLRRSFLISFIIGIPSLVLWILTTVSANTEKKVWLLIAAISLDVLEDWFLATPLSDKLLGHTFRKAIDAKHTMARYESFFIIALGEGVFLLVRGSPLKQGFSPYLSRGIEALLIYFFLNWTYFHGDTSKRFVHALYRRWWVKWLWFL